MVHQSFWHAYHQGYSASLAVGETHLHCPRSWHDSDDWSPSGFITGWHSAQDLLRGEQPRVHPAAPDPDVPFQFNTDDRYRIVALSCWDSREFDVSGPSPWSDLNAGAFIVYIQCVPNDISTEHVLAKYQECIIPWVPNAPGSDCQLIWRDLSRALPGVPIDPSLTPYLDTTNEVYRAPNLVAVVPDIPVPFSELDHGGR